MTVLNEYDIYFSHLLSPRRKLNVSKSSSNSNTSKYVKRNTCPGKFEEDIDIEAEEYIKQKLKRIIMDGDVEQKDNASKQEEEEVYVDAKAEEFIKQKKSELSKVYMNVG